MKKNKKERKEKGYMTVCSSCGSTSWVDYNEDWIINELLSDGSMMYKIESPFFAEYICDSCEKPNGSILFSDVGRIMRRKIYTMSEEDRMAWVQGFWTIHKLKQDESQ